LFLKPSNRKSYDEIELLRRRNELKSIVIDLDQPSKPENTNKKLVETLRSSLDHDQLNEKYKVLILGNMNGKIKA
jgi:hypothetical protein